MTDRFRDIACTVLAAVGGLTAAAGLAFVVLYDTALFANTSDGVNAAFWPERVVDPVLRAYQHFVHAVLGATLGGWGITIAALAHVPLRRGERWAWWTLLVAALTWFIADTAASAALGVNQARSSFCLREAGISARAAARRHRRGCSRDGVVPVEPLLGGSPGA